jgi:hypothetical protein
MPGTLSNMIRTSPASALTGTAIRTVLSSNEQSFIVIRSFFPRLFIAVSPYT